MRALISIFCLLFLVQNIVIAQAFPEIKKAVANDRGLDDQFGNAVAISGDFALVGAYSDDFGAGQNRGSVYVYKQIGLNNWVQFQKLVASDQQDYDRFGWSVAISGDYAVIGAYREDHDASGANNLSNAGSAYVFEKNTSGNWVQVQKIVASDRAIDDEFGWSVAINGNTLVVGARAEDHNVSGGAYMYSAGSAYIFTRDGGGVWNQTQKIVAGDRATDMNYPAGYSGEDLGDQFGWSVGIWGDYMVVGALHHDYGPSGPPSGALWSSGAAYIFERSAGVWSQVQKIQSFDREAWDRFGCAVAIDSNVLVVGAYSEDELADGVSGSLTNPGSAYIFQRNGAGTWLFAQKIVPNDRNSGDHFGWAFSLEDSTLVVGTHSDDHDELGNNVKDDAGSAYIFKKSGGVWSQFQKIAASDRDTLDEFGYTVGLSNQTIIVGALYQNFDELGTNDLNDAGAAYFFSSNVCPTYTTNQNINLCFGGSITIGSNTYSTDGNYSDFFITSEGCDSTVNTNLVVLPEITSSNSMTVCFGQGATIGGTFYNTAGTYSAIYTAANTCDSIVFTTLIIDPEISSTSFVSVCAGEGYTINGNYEDSSGIYPTPYMAVNGCDSIHYTNLTVEAEITATQNVSICYGESYTIGLNTYTISGTYTDIVSATNFCDSIITTILDVQLPVNKSVHQNKNYLTANAPSAGYQWINCTTNSPIAGATSQIYVATQIGYYAVIVTENGCTDTSACVYVSAFTVGLEEIGLEEYVSVQPNPNNGEFWIITKPTSKNLSFKLLNSVGQNIDLNEYNDFIKPANKLSPGVYVLIVSDGIKSDFIKIIVAD